MIKEFTNSDHFKKWLLKNVKSNEGIWVRIYKDNNKKTITAAEALDICLCFGWIDGKMKSEGEKSYLKYFAPRTENSKWSEKNKKAIERLRKNNLMTEYGEESVKKAIKNGHWNKEKIKLDFDELILEFMSLLNSDKETLTKFKDCSLSIKKRYCGFYFDAKTEQTKKKRLEKIILALKENNKGMLY